jgi:transposase
MKKERKVIEVVHERCAGIDVHKQSIVVCLITPELREVRTFGTMTNDLEKMVNWLESHCCTHAAMESTGVFWKPAYNLLELTDIETIIVNAQHIKAVPGRKTDVKDSEWIAELLRHGLLQGSYIPNREQRELRELVRYRRSLIQERSREINRLQKVLEGANIKLSSVATDITGVSAQLMIEALIKGEDDVEHLAQFAKGKMRNKIADLEKALKGTLGSHQKMMLTMQLAHIAALEESIADLDKEVADRMLPFQEALALIQTIPGMKGRNAEELIAELGIDMNRFPSADHVSSWAGMSPGNNESAGKRKSGKSRKGNKHLRSTLVRGAKSAAKKKDSYFYAQYRKIAGRRGKNRAAVAVGHSILIIAYHMLKKNQTYMELGANYFEQRSKEATIKRAVQLLQRVGISINVEQLSA